MAAHTGENWLQIETGKAADSTMGGKLFVKYNSASELAYELCDAQGEMAHGVNAFDGVSGDILTIVKSGVVEVECSEAISLHEQVTTQNDGTAMGAVSGDHVLGICLRETSGTGEYALVELSLPGIEEVA